MTTFLTIRDSIKSFYIKYDFIFRPIAKFILALLLVTSINGGMGYFLPLEKGAVVFLIAFICAFIPLEGLAAFGTIMVLAHTGKVALDVTLACLGVVVIIYGGYLRFAPKMGVLVLMIPFLIRCKLIYALPVICGFVFGPVSIAPVGFGMAFWQYQTSLADLGNVLATSSGTDEEDAVIGYQYMVQAIAQNKLIMLCALVFAVVILVTHIIYKTSFKYSWFVAFLVGGVLNIILFLVGGVVTGVDVPIAAIIVQSLIGIAFSFVIQFFKGIVDYTHTEILQFEDDDYFYYVKAIPKLKVPEVKKDVKHINRKKIQGDS